MEVAGRVCAPDPWMWGRAPAKSATRDAPAAGRRGRRAARSWFRARPRCGAPDPPDRHAASLAARWPRRVATGARHRAWLEDRHDGSGHRGGAEPCWRARRLRAWAAFCARSRSASHSSHRARASVTGLTPHTGHGANCGASSPTRALWRWPQSRQRAALRGPRVTRSHRSQTRSSPSSHGGRPRTFAGPQRSSAGMACGETGSRGTRAAS